jgi:hypothetical protein
MPKKKNKIFCIHPNLNCMKDLHEGYQVINPEDEVINNTLT